MIWALWALHGKGISLLGWDIWGWKGKCAWAPEMGGDGLLKWPAKQESGDGKQIDKERPCKGRKFWGVRDS